MGQLDLGRAASLLTFGAMALGGGTLLGIGLFLFNQAPIWYVPGNHKQGVTSYEYVYKMMYEIDHVPIEQAQRDAYYLYEEAQNVY